MKKFATYSIILALTAFYTLSAQAQSVKIAALVNGEVITTSDIQNRINAFLMTTQIPLNAQTRGMILQRVLNNAVDEKIKLQEAVKNGITITADDLKGAIASYEKNNKIPAGQMKTMLRRANVSQTAFNEQMKSDLAWLRLVRKKVLGVDTITQTEINQSLADAKKDLETPKYQISEIFIKKENAKNISDLVSNLRNDPRFALYAMQFSDSPSAANGGNLGWINEGKLAEPLEKAVKKLKVGAVSDPILSGDGYYILKLEKRFNPEVDKPAIPDKKEIKRFLENQKMEDYSRKHLQDLRQQAVIEIRN